MSVVLGKINNYIRSMSTGNAAMDLSAVDEKADDDKENSQNAEENKSDDWPNATDLNYMGKDGQRKGKGEKGDKGGGKGGRFEGYCNYCWIYGHKAAECFKNPNAKGSQKGKGKDKGSQYQQKGSW
eukprot:6766629-Karenia_brevis.AAC.1